MDITDIRATKRRIIEDHLGALLKDYEDIVKQSASALAAPERNRLDRQAREIWERVEAVEHELKNLELSPADPAQAFVEPDSAQIHRQLRAKLPEIDFVTMEQALRTILDRRWDEGCAALLLFQHSVRMGGEWCAARIRALLARETCPGCFRHFQIEFHTGFSCQSIIGKNQFGLYAISLRSPVNRPQSSAMNRKHLR